MDTNDDVKPENFMTLSFAGEELFYEGIEAIYKNSEEKVYKLTETDTLEPDLSMIYIVGNKPKCFIVTQKTPSGILKVLRLFGSASDNKSYLHLIKFAVTEALKKYPPETAVYIEPVCDMNVQLFEQLFPDVETPLYMAGANVSFEGELASDTFDELRIIYENERSKKKISICDSSVTELVIKI